MLQTYNEVTHTLSLLWTHKLITIAGVKLSFGNLFIALTLLLFATRLARLVVKIINRRLILPFVPDKGLQNTYQTFAFYGALAAVVTMSLTVAGIPLTVFAVGGGALAIGVGFGSQNIVNNFISGVILMVEQPIRLGDMVEVDGITGSVVSIGTRSAKIKTGDNKVFIVPNSFLLEKGVMNWNYETNILRNVITFGVAYGSDVELVKNLCLEILSHTIGVEHSPIPEIYFDDFGDNNLSFQLIFFSDITKVNSLPQIRSDVRFKIDEKFRKHQIQMAFPQRDVHFRIDKALDVRVLS